MHTHTHTLSLALSLALFLPYRRVMKMVFESDGGLSSNHGYEGFTIRYSATCKDEEEVLLSGTYAKLCEYALLLILNGAYVARG